MSKETVKKLINYDWVSTAKPVVCVYAGICALALLVSLIFGLNIAVEFRGGTMITYSYTGDIDTDEVEAAVGDANIPITPGGSDMVNFGSVTVTTGTAFTGGAKTVTIAFVSNSGLTADVQTALSDSLQSRFPGNQLSVVNSQDVNPSSGAAFFWKCMVALIFSFILVIVYIAFRFRKIGGFSAGVFTFVTLMSDVLMVMASFAFFRFDIDANFIAVTLTIIGYSINNTVVIFDRIRENRSILGNKIPFRQLVNKSVVQSFTRTLNTTLATVIAVLIICVVAMVMGVSSIMSFAFPMMIGMLSGFVSSPLLSGPLWVLWQERRAANKPTKSRA